MNHKLSDKDLMELAERRAKSKVRKPIEDLQEKDFLNKDIQVLCPKWESCVCTYQNECTHTEPHTIGTDCLFACTWDDDDLMCDYVDRVVSPPKPTNPVNLEKGSDLERDLDF